MISDSCYKGTVLQRDYRKNDMGHGHFPIIAL